MFRMCVTYARRSRIRSMRATHARAVCSLEKSEMVRITENIKSMWWKIAAVAGAVITLLGVYEFDDSAEVEFIYIQLIRGVGGDGGVSIFLQAGWLVGVCVNAGWTNEWRYNLSHQRKVSQIDFWFRVNYVMNQNKTGLSEMPTRRFLNTRKKRREILLKLNLCLFAKQSVVGQLRNSLFF